MQGGARATEAGKAYGASLVRRPVEENMGHPHPHQVGV